MPDADSQILGPRLARRAQSWGTLALALGVVLLCGDNAYFVTDRVMAKVVMLTLAKGALTLGLWWSFHSLAVLVRSALRREAHPVLANPAYLVFFGLFTAWFGFWLYGLWPGLMISDSFATVEMLEQVRFHAWFSYLHTFLYLTLFQLRPHIAVVGVFQVLLGAGLFAWIGGTLFQRSRLLGTGFVVAVCCSLPVVANVVSYHLDLIFTCLYVGAAFFAFKSILEYRESGARLSPKSAVRLGVCLAAVALYRGEGVFLFGLVPLVFWLNRAATPRTLAVLVGTAGALFLVLARPVPSALYRLMGTEDLVAAQKLSYPLTLRMNALGYILQQPHFSRDPAADDEELSRVVDVPKLKELSHPYETPAFWGGHYNQQMTREDFRRFDARFRQLALDNLPLFLISRLHTFLASFGISANTSFYFSDHARGESIYRGNCRNGCPEAVPHEPLSPALYRRLIGVLDSSTRFQGARLEGAFLHWNLLPALFLLFAALWLYAWTPATASVALLVFARLVVVVLAEPAAQFKYHLSLQFFGLMVPFLLATEWMSLRKRRAGQGGVELLPAANDAPGERAA